MLTYTPPVLRSKYDRVLSILTQHRWLLTAAFGGVAFSVFAGIDRLLEWDEAVFFSQSGGYRGIRAPAVTVGPTREGGPIGLIWLIRQTGLDLHGVRAIWIGVVLLGALAAFWTIARTGGRSQGLIGLGIYLSFWISWVASGFLHGPMIAGIAGLSAIALYSLAVRSRSRSEQVLKGILLGLALALMFWFRPVESGALAIGVLIFSVVVDFKSFWVQRSSVWISAGATVAIGFFVPWTIWSSHLFGSVSARLQAMRGRATSAKWDLHWGVTDWIDLLTGHRRTFGSSSSTPSWSDGVMVAGMVVVGLAVVFVAIVGVTTWRRGNVDQSRTRLLSVIAFGVPTVLYMFLRTDTQERYASLWWIYASWIVALAIGDVRSWSSSWKPSRFAQRTAATGGILVVIIWLVAQIGVASSHQAGLTKVELIHGRRALFAERLVESGSCSAGVRFSLPVHQVLAGCKMFTVTDAESVVSTATKIEERGSSGYIFWTGDRESVILGEDWFIPRGADWGDNRTMWVYQGVSDP